MAEYSKGDIVLLSDSKLGIMTSSNTVREIRGEETSYKRIVKKLTAKQLAESLVDLMERYKNLESKKQNHKRTPNIKYDLSHTNTTDITATNTTNTTTTSGTKRTNITNMTNTDSSTPKPKAITMNTILKIPKTPNYANHALSPTDSMQKKAKFNKHIFYHTAQNKNTNTNTLKPTSNISNTSNTSNTPSTKSNDESNTNTNTNTTSTISSLSPNICTTMDIETRNNTRNRHKSPKPKKKLFAKSKKNKSKSNNNNNKNRDMHLEATKTEHIQKTKSTKFFSKKNSKNKKNKISKRSSSNNTQKINNNINNSNACNSQYVSCETYEYNNNGLPFSYIRSNENDYHLLPAQHKHTQYENNIAPKTRFSRSKSTDTHPYNNHASSHNHNIHYTPNHNNTHNTQNNNMQNMNEQHYHTIYGYQHNPYFIAYTPSHNTANSTITPPIPSPNAHTNHNINNIQYQYLHNIHNIGYHPSYLNTMSPSNYSSTAPIPAQYLNNINTHNSNIPPPYHLYNKYNLHSQSNPNPNPTDGKSYDENKLIDVLLSAPDNNMTNKLKCTDSKKQKSHPISYKKRTVPYNKMMESRTNLTQSPSQSNATNHTKESTDTLHTAQPPTYPQQYVPQINAHNKNPLNLLKSPEPQQNVDPIIQNYHHIKNNININNNNNNNNREHIKNTSATIESNETLRDNYIYNEHSYTNSSIYNNKYNLNYKINKHYAHNNDSSLIYDSYNGMHSISPRNSRRDSTKNHSHYQSHSMHNNTHQRGGSHSPHNSYHRQQRKNYHSPRAGFGQRPFSANQKMTNYFDFGTQPQIPYHHSKRKRNSSHNHAHTKSNTKSVTFSEIDRDGKEFSNAPNSKTIRRIYPSNNNKPKLSQNNAYSSPVYHNNEYGMHHKRIYKNKKSNNHWKQAKTMGNTDLNDNDANWYMTRHWPDEDENNENEGVTVNENDILSNHERSHTDTMIIHNNNNNNPKDYIEHTKSHSFSHVGMSMDDMMTPLQMDDSPAPHMKGHRKQKRSQSVIEFFDPNIPSNLADLHNMIDDNNHRKSIDIDDNHTDGENQNDKNYKIVLRKENSNKAYYIQDNIRNNNNQLIKPRFSQSTTSVQTAQSNTSFTPTISQTPSYLREDKLWQKSMTHKISHTASSEITSEDDGDWMMYNQINVNGNTNSESVKHFFGNDVDTFPNIESPSNQSNDTVKINHEKKKPMVPPKLSHHDIANEHELQKQLNRKYRKHKPNISPSNSKSSFQ